MRREYNNVQTEIDSNTLLLLHGNEFVNASQLSGVTVTNVNSVQISNDGKFDKAFYWPSSGAGYQGWIDCDIGSANKVINGIFTIDCWLKISNTTKTYKVVCDLGDHYTCYFDATENNKYTQVNNGNGTSFSWNTGAHDLWGIGGDYNTCLFTANVWTHVAIVGNGTNTRFYKDGVQQLCSTPANGIINYVMSMANGKIRIGNIAYPGLNRQFRGYISEFRFSNVARWTENFTPPTQPY